MFDHYKIKLTTVYEMDELNISGIRIRKADGSEVVRIHPCEKSFIEFPISELHTKVFKLRDYGVLLSPTAINEIMEGIETRYSSMSVIDETVGLGFMYDDNGEPNRYTCSASFDMNGNNLLFDPYKQLPVSKGVFTDAVRNTLNVYLSANIKRQLVFLFALSSIICGIVNKTILLAIVGKSSTGKTILSRLALSSFCSPDYDRLSKTLCGTDNSILKYMDNLKGVPILLDDASLKDAERKIVRFENLIYTLANGKSKGRLTKNHELAKEFTWHSAVTLSAEDSILDKCNAEREGVFARLFEVQVSDTELFDSAEECSRLKFLCENNYGLVAPIYLKYLLNIGVAKIRSMYSDEIKRIRTAEDAVDGLTSRIIENIAMVTLTANLAEVALGMTFDVDGIKNYLLSVTAENIDDLRVKQNGHTVVTEIYPELLKVATACGSKYYHRDGFIILPNQLPVATGGSLKHTLLRELGARYGITPKQIKAELKNQKLLVINAGNYGWIGTIDGESVRGLALVLSLPTGGDDNE